jgi:hypothetical protein
MIPDHRAKLRAEMIVGFSVAESDVIGFDQRIDRFSLVYDDSQDFSDFIGGNIDFNDTNHSSSRAQI